jgi:hypothetical protein
LKSPCIFSGQIFQELEVRVFLKKCFVVPSYTDEFLR